MSSEPPADQLRPTLRVIRGDATDEEIAALLAVIAAKNATATDAETGRPTANAWTDRAAAGLRRPLRPGPGAWTASAWPH